MSEYLISIKIEELEEGGYLATSDTLQGLVAQGRTAHRKLQMYCDRARIPRRPFHALRATCIKFC